jgi:serine/threonine protein kinase
MNAGVPAPLGVVKHYNLLERLEPSGPGDLYRARDTQHGRTVTVRLLPADFFRDRMERDRLLGSVRALTVVSHPNVTLLFDAGDHEGRVFLAFEFLKGQSLRSEAAGRPMNVRRAIELAIQIADGVAEAHAAGFNHGGLSPDTIVITAKGHAKIPAFALASSGGFEQGPSGMRLGDYDSPEEARGEPPDDRSDIYSIGAILYEMLTTKRPMHRGAAAPSASNPAVPKEVDDLVLRAVAPNPERRVQTAATLAAELRSVAAVLEVRGVAADDDEAVPGRSTSVGRVLLVTVIVLMLVALVMWLIFRA